MNQQIMLQVQETSRRALQTVLVEPDVAFVILARNEEGILGETLLDLSTYLTANESIHVVADHCDDGTAAVARQADVEVWERNGDQPSGKGAALGWWLQQTGDQPPDQIIVVLDADSRVSPGFPDALRAAFREDTRVLQARILPSLVRKAPGALVSALSELSEQYVDDRIRGRLGWPVRLRGTGMAFRRDVLHAHARELHTLVEDVELSLLLAANGEKIVPARELTLFDPKPVSNGGVINQRARWLRGQVQVWRDYGPQIGRIIRQGLPGISLLASLLLKPKTLVWLGGMVISMLLLAVQQLAGFSAGGKLAAGLTMLYAFVEGIKIMYTFTRIPDRRQIWKALMYVPLFGAFWFHSFILAALSGNTWLRSRPELDPNRIG